MSYGSRLRGSLGMALFIGLFTIIVGFRMSVARDVTPAADVLQIDLDRLIDAAAKDRNRFAVDIPHAIDASRMGKWSVSGGLATWHYSVRIPTAVSLSFHAPNIFLPANAQLTVRGGGNTYIYRAADTSRRALWSRISKGDSLDLQLTVAPKDRGAVRLQIASLQAGYRGFGHAVADHPHYAQLKAQAAVGSTSTCIVNYECDVTTANTPAGQATVALIVSNAYQCSGTLVNDVPQDGTPYVLTARHCETGQLGGGNPAADSSVMVYWDATSVCGTTLGTLYDPGIPTQTGAKTVVEQQDSWLLLLSQPPVVSDAYLAGFDASGGAIQGGYTIHHARSYDKQFTAWNGQAAADTVAANTAFAVNYTANYWAAVNSQGTIGPGASGSALFDQNNRLVGSLSLESTVGATADGYAQCPVSSPPTPTAQNATAYFTSLAAVWNSTADTTGTAATIKQVLDPNNTATLVVNSIPAPQKPQITAAQLAIGIGSEDLLTWGAPGASTCMATGGASGDGWSGTVPTSGSQSVGRSTTGPVTYGISCTYPDSHTSSSQVTITWLVADPLANLFAQSEEWAGASWALTWSTNVPPCQLTGGSAAQTLSGSSGTIAVTENTPGRYDYHITCGSGSAQDDALITIISPTVTFNPNTTDLQLGQALELQWNSLANSCTPGGGTGNDGWPGTQLTGLGFESYWPTSVGTYTYTLNCMAGNASAQAAVTVTVENNPAYATLTVSSNEIAIGQTVTASYKSNIAGCILGQSAVPGQDQGIFETTVAGGESEGTRTYVGGNVGASQLTLDCGAQGSTPTIVSATPQTVTVVANVESAISAPASATIGTPFTLSWQISNASSCSAAGGGADGTQWTGSVAPTAGQLNITPTVAGTFTYTLTCVGHLSTDTQTVQAVVTVTAAASSPPPPSGGGSGNSSSGSSSGSKSGGGAFDELTIGVLALVWLMSARQSSRHRPG